MKNIVEEFRHVAPRVDFWSLRLVCEETESVNVREGVVQPPHVSESRGLHITFVDRGAMAYAATSSLTRGALREACDRGLRWLEVTRRHGLFCADRVPRPQQSGSYVSPVLKPWESWSLGDKIDVLQQVNRNLKINDTIVDWQAHLTRRRSTVTLVTSDGITIDQDFHYLLPGYAAVANKGAQTQMRTGGGWGSAWQGGFELLESRFSPQRARQVAEEACAMVDAPECPTGQLDLLLMPNQMMLQIHESIGHPLELDRILGDERNFAGTSFVSLAMFGQYRYGSELLNVTFDPTRTQELAAYEFDDDGMPAERTYLIRDGLLLRPLGAAISQMRAGIPGVANARAADWNRPTIDRMANLNIEPGESSFDALVQSIESGVLMDTNRSWSIDDSRNKFQFGCELGRLIEDGELKGFVRNPNYRGISATFWRNLAGVGDRDTFEVWGTPYCGKGEPNQVIQVGHASPACVFRNIEVFGGG